MSRGTRFRDYGRRFNLTDFEILDDPPSRTLNPSTAEGSADTPWSRFDVEAGPTGALSLIEQHARGTFRPVQSNDNGQHLHYSEATHPVSLTITRDGHIPIWSETLASEFRHLERNVPYRPNELVALTVFDGDWTASAQWFAEHYGVTEEMIDDYVSEVTEWDDPIPIRVQPRLPNFPDHHLVSWVGAYVRALARATQTPVDLCAQMALSALGVAIGGKAEVEVRPEWVEPTNLFTVTPLEPGARKSAVVKAYARPFLKYQLEKKDDVKADIIEKQALKRRAEGSLAKLIRDLTKSDQDEIDEETKQDRDEKVAARARLVDEIEMPVYPRLLADDATPEALASLMAEQGGRIGVLSAEGDIFDIMAGRYSGETNLGIYLRGHSGDAYLLDRKGRAPEFIARPALTLGLAPQPSVVREIGQKKAFRGRGMLARFLYSMAPDLVGDRDSNPPAIDPGVAKRFEENMAALISTMAAWDEPMRLSLTVEAHEAVIRFSDQIEARLAPGGDLYVADMLRTWGSKLVGASVRIAGLLHVADRPGEAHRFPIDVETIAAAIDIAGSYYIDHAKAAFDLMGQDDIATDAEAILAWIKRARIKTFTKREVHVNHRARFPRAEDIDAPLTLLEGNGWIAKEPSPRRSGAGRPASPKFNVNPKAHNT